MRLLSLLAAMLLAVGLLAGCGGGGEGEPKEEAAAPASQEETTTEETTIEETTTEETTVSPETTVETTASESTTEPSSSSAESNEDASEDQGAASTTVTVTRVVDGDTVEISPAIDGIEEVRLIGVDTPETRRPGCLPQPYGGEASAFTRSQIGGRVVGLEFDVEKTDRYGRLLAYVYPPDDTMFNETLLREGYAQVATFPPNVKYVDRFLAAQDEARAAGRGLWGLSAEQLAAQTDQGNGIGGGGCAPEVAPQQKSEPEPSPEPAPRAAPNPPPETPTEPQPESIPTAPSGVDVDCSDFGSSAEAQAYLLPGDPHGLDRDGDGQACDSLR